MNIRLILRLSALCWIALLLPSLSFATLQQEATQAGSAVETNPNGAYFLVLDKSWQNDSPQTLDITYNLSDALLLDNVVATSANSVELAAVPALKPVTFGLLEPITMGLLATGIVGLLLLNRRPKNVEM